MLAIRLTFILLDSDSRRAHLLLPSDDDPDLQDLRRKYVYVVVGYALTIALGLVVPVAAVVLYFALAIVLVVPFRTVAQVLAGKYPTDET